jgi:hypothetical protein
MAEAKTRPSAQSVASYLKAIEDPARRADCEALVALMRRVTKREPAMWGTSIVGFGLYRYTYESGRSGEACAIGLASRKGDISVYLSSEAPAQDALLRTLGKHKMGKGCLSIKRLADVDTAVLESIIAQAFAAVSAKYTVA